MAEITVAQLAEMVGVSIERLLTQMHEAGLSQRRTTEGVTEYDRQVLLAHLKRKHGDSEESTKQHYKYVSDSKPISTSKQGQREFSRIKQERKKKSRLHQVQSSQKSTAKPPRTITNKPKAVTLEQPKKAETSQPKVFLSYSYDSREHEHWVESLGGMLRSDGIDIILDKWHLHLGDPITEFMERSIRDSDFVLIICTEKYKQKSDARKGGVGYEEAIISSDIFVKANHRKYIPIMRSQEPERAIPTALHSKKYLDLSDEDAFNSSYQALLLALYGRGPVAPPLGAPPKFIQHEG